MNEQFNLENDVELNSLALQMKAAMLRDSFFNQRNGVFAGNNAFTDKPHPYEAEDIDSVILSHLSGVRARAKNLKTGEVEERQFRFGSYTIQIGSGKTKFLVIDIDGGSTHKSSLKYPDQVAIDLMVRARSLGVYPYLEKSKSGAGWHLWIFFDELMEASKARKLGFLICNRDYELVDGGLSKVKSGKGLEVFPKQDFVAEGSFGNLIWLPWYYKAEVGNNQFYKCLEALC